MDLSGRGKSSLSYVQSQWIFEYRSEEVHSVYSKIAKLRKGDLFLRLTRL